MPTYCEFCQSESRHYTVSIGERRAALCTLCTHAAIVSFGFATKASALPGAPRGVDAVVRRLPRVPLDGEGVPAAA